MAYFNLGGLGTTIKTIGQIGLEAVGAASTVYGAYKGLSGGATSPGQKNVAVAGGPTATAHPVTTAPGAILSTIEKVMDPTFLGGPAHPAAHGRYFPAGTKGTHMIKKGPHAGLWVKNRHRNPCNIHALRRALSRAHSFEKIARHVVHFVHPKQSHGVAHFKKRRRSR